jgi:hypothetical protein
MSKALFFVLGEHGSGKSAWLSMHASGVQLPGYNLTCAGYVTANLHLRGQPTKQLQRHQRNVAGMDEAVIDPNNPRRSETVRSVFQAVRTLPTEGRMDILRTGEGGSRGLDRIRSPFIFASDTLPEHVMDRSRMFVFEMNKNPNRGDLYTMLTKEISSYEMETIRKDIFLYSLKILPFIKRP